MGFVEQGSDRRRHRRQSSRRLKVAAPITVIYRI